ncbi:spindle and centriole-associated protein 1 isoform X3 [Hoplias malabaricus]|uniref:spindle and centriole-associated protein 1 isoform X3 n=1 Tax=Hoplias malabaricus TaxID=27720 RepID=UPI00346191EF
MSFVRFNRRPGRTKKVSATKKEWVSTVNDLTVHKATPEELSRRHEMHRSRNKSLAQWELREKGLKRMQRKSQLASPPGLDQARLRIIREVFSDQCQLQDVLARSDRAMAVVKDLFGDAPRRQTGFPNITMAPDCDSDSELPVLQKPDPPTQLSLLSQSMMDQRALNELKDSEEEHGEYDLDTSLSFTSETSRPPQWITKQRQQHNISKTPCNAEESGSQAGGKNRYSRTNRGRSSGASGPDGSGFSCQSANQSSLELLQDMLGQVETELAFLEPQGPPGSVKPLNQHRGLTGFSVALVSTLARIASHIRQREEEAQKEAQERKRLEVEVREQKALIDALTAECFSLREESTTLKVNLQDQITELEQRVDMVILGLADLGSGEEREFGPEAGAVPSVDAEPVPDETHLQKQASKCPAVLLSPPRQRDSRTPPTGSCSSASVGTVEDSEARCTPSSFVSLPDSILPRPVQLLDPQAQDAILREITDLTKQNAIIQARIGPCRPSPTGASVAKKMPTVSTKERQPSLSTGQQQKQQCVGAADSVRLMEDRLQELNRQSAAARAKLLELIEQQKQSTSLNISPSISPIPPHSTSPNTAAGQLTQGSYLFAPERGQPSDTPSRRSAGAISPQSLEVNKLKGEGWFALSAHVQ